MKTLIILGAAVASAAIWLWFLLHYDRTEREPLRVILRVGILGGCAAVFVAGILNSTAAAVAGVNIDNMGLYAAFGMSLFIGFNEESVKAFSTWLLVRHEKELDEPIDGLIYSMTVALGFAALENVQYLSHYGFGVILSRSLLSVPVHLFLAALWGYGLSKARFIDPEHRYFKAMAPYVAMAALLHALYDFLIFTRTWAAILVIPLLIFLLVTANRRLKWMAEQSEFLAAGQCSQCGRKNNVHAAYCESCGTPMNQTFFNLCDKCNKKVPLNFSFCPDCGTATGEKASM